MLLHSKEHMGHLFLRVMRERPEHICQIDGATGESETNSSVLHRSIRLTIAIRNIGLVPGDVLALGGRNHLDIHIPYYAGIMHGLPIMGVDPLYKLDEIKALFKVSEPKIAFCDQDYYECYKEAASQLGQDIKIVHFGNGPNSLDEFVAKYDDGTPDDEFRVTEFDGDKIYAWLVSTGGTTGVLKLAAIKHSAWISKKKSLMTKEFFYRPPSAESKVMFNVSPVQWISGYFNAVAMPVEHQIKLQTSGPATSDHIIDIINKYKPKASMFGPSLITSILKNKKPCDLSCFEALVLTGGKIYPDILVECKKRIPQHTILVESYGQTELIGPALAPNPFGPLGTCGRPAPGMEVKLLDPETGKEITEPHVPGEFCIKTTMRFTEYYKNPEETAKVLTEDGWFQTGDLLYRDEDNNYFFVERSKMLIKYRNYQIIPTELEEVIRTNEGVQEVSVTCVPHTEDGEHAVACVVTRPGYDVTAQEIHDLVTEKLSETKQLRGGVVFMKELPMTSAGKIARAKLRNIIMNSLN